MAVAVVAVRPVAVDVVHGLVDVLMVVRFARPILVAVEMMEVGVDVGVRVEGPVVMVGVDVLFPDDQGHPGGHEQSGRG
jgi:hypothetical protein